ncbi:MAG: putative nucleotide-diphospho-sugar transferase [Pseudomonadota bacterium]
MTDENVAKDPLLGASWRRELNRVDAGFVFAATGGKYTALAHQAAESVKRIHPEMPIDLFTDVEVNTPIYDQVHQLERAWFRPKFEAIARSRFERTVYLDSDLVVVADVSDLFWLLGKYDLAAAHVQSRNASWSTTQFAEELPNAFPQVNSGVMAVRKNERTRKLMEDVAEAIAKHQLKMDQAALRQAIWRSDVSLYVIPPEYNVRGHRGIVGETASSSAPRILHSSKFHKKMKGNEPPSPGRIYGFWTLKSVRYSIARDKQLTEKPIPTSLWNFLKS